MAQTWSTLTTTRAGQFTHWRELICEAFLDLAPETDLRAGFAGVVTQWPFGDLSLARIDFGGRSGNGLCRSSFSVGRSFSSSFTTSGRNHAFANEGDIAANHISQSSRKW